MSGDANCVFCKIAAGELPASIVYQTESLVAFLDITPLADGHLLLIPRKHYSRLVEMTPEDCGDVCSSLPILGRALMDVTGSQAFNVLQNNGPDAGQVVPHVHFHLIPRGSTDGLGYRWNTGKYAPGQDTALAEAYRSLLGQASS